jgi:hypothetical protein
VGEFSVIEAVGLFSEHEKSAKDPKTRPATIDRKCLDISYPFEDD